MLTFEPLPLNKNKVVPQVIKMRNISIMPLLLFLLLNETWCLLLLHSSQTNRWALLPSCSMTSRTGSSSLGNARWTRSYRKLDMWRTTSSGEEKNKPKNKSTKKLKSLRVKLLKDKHNKTWGILDKVFKIYTAWLVLSSCTFACVWVCHHVFLYLFWFFLFCFFKSVSLSSERFCKSKPQTNHDSSAAVQNTVTKLYRDKRKGQFGRWK